jgi:hypothetical protein
MRHSEAANSAGSLMVRHHRVAPLQAVVHCVLKGLGDRVADLTIRARGSRNPCHGEGRQCVGGVRGFETGEKLPGLLGCRGRRRGGVRPRRCVALAVGSEHDRFRAVRPAAGRSGAYEAAGDHLAGRVAAPTSPPRARSSPHPRRAPIRAGQFSAELAGAEPASEDRQADFGSISGAVCIGILRK